MHLSDSYYYYIKAFLNTSLIAFLKSLLILTKADLLYLMLADLAPHMPQLSFDMIMDKHHYYVSKHFILTSVLIIIFYLVFIWKDNLKIFC